MKTIKKANVRKLGARKTAGRKSAAKSVGARKFAGIGSPVVLTGAVVHVGGGTWKNSPARKISADRKSSSTRKLANPLLAALDQVAADAYIIDPNSPTWAAEMAARRASTSKR